MGMRCHAAQPISNVEVLGVVVQQTFPRNLSYGGDFTGEVGWRGDGTRARVLSAIQICFL